MEKDKIEELAKEIFEFLYENKIWVDVSIYFNHKCWSTHKSNHAVFVVYRIDFLLMLQKQFHLN